ncbi:sensor histidine kinase [Sphingomonas sp. H39-1-10]|uniref:sensor histidine kinase n=1 Tax=Sphingomonas pollutisoli TaxID=3030829 RepID=UPI0023BA1F5E|nr:sensor histidine kinase [Sphingomonas pollutisoli]MDF0488433.1 sensor histidine kinase [Sphingomonas pollutisoli]
MPAPQRAEDASSGDANAEALRAELKAAREQLDCATRSLAASEARERLLQNELQHRVRNMLAVVRSIFARTVEAGGALEDVADHFKGRLDAVSRYQFASAIDPRGTIDLDMMIWDELRVFEFDPRVAAAGPEARVPYDIAVVLGLAFHELATNSIKFGALADTARGATVHIRWELSQGELSLTWEETGVSIVMPAPVPRGFGREFIEAALPYQIGATTAFELRPGGIRCTITVPLNAR